MPPRGSHALVDPTNVAVPKPLPIQRIERALLAKLQSECVEFGPYYCWHRSTHPTDDKKRSELIALQKSFPLMFPRNVTVDGIIKEADHRYRMHDGLLYRVVQANGGIELRICAPTGSAKQILALLDVVPMKFRRELIYYYHNGLLGQHIGREQTIERISSDWYWRKLRADVTDWCLACATCRSNHASPAVSAWTRTTLYSRPFRCLEFDIVTCCKDERTGHKHLLTVICLFSRWCWAIPLREKESSEIGEALLREVFGPWGIWCTVLRSDNAKEFLSKTIQYINTKLENEHITGAVYHPQSQGSVERLHRKINDYMRGIFSGVADNQRTNWVAFVPFVVGHLRMMKMEALGGRSPMMVVTGLDPKPPVVLMGQLPVSEVGVDQYVAELIDYFASTYKEV